MYHSQVSACMLSPKITKKTNIHSLFFFFFVREHLLLAIFFLAWFCCSSRTGALRETRLKMACWNLRAGLALGINVSCFIILLSPEIEVKISVKPFRGLSRSVACYTNAGLWLPTGETSVYATERQGTCTSGRITIRAQPELRLLPLESSTCICHMNQHLNMEFVECQLVWIEWRVAIVCNTYTICILFVVLSLPCSGFNFLPLNSLTKRNKQYMRWLHSG